MQTVPENAIVEVDSEMCLTAQFGDTLLELHLATIILKENDVTISQEYGIWFGSGEQGKVIAHFDPDMELEMAVMFMLLLNSASVHSSTDEVAKILEKIVGHNSRTDNGLIIPDTATVEAISVDH